LWAASATRRVADEPDRHEVRRYVSTVEIHQSREPLTARSHFGDGSLAKR
jgi:hypothetical protein